MSTSIQIETDIVLNVLCRKETLLYSSSYDSNEVAISFLDVTTNLDSDLVASDCVSISDRSSSLVSNRIEISEEEFVLEGISEYTFDTDQILVTDQFVDIADGSKISLFYKHVISTDNLPRVSSTDYTIASGSVLTEVNLLNKEFVEISIDEMGVDFNKGIVYNNLNNRADGSSEIYYIQYSFRTGSDIFTYTEILDNEEVYRLATVDDFDEDLEVIQDGRKVYLLEESLDGFTFIFPIASDFGFKNKSESKIEVLPFSKIGFEDNWFPYLSNGSFYSKIQSDTYKFYIAQFSNQFWNPESPYKKVDSELSLYISTGLIKLNHGYLHEDSGESLYLDILINDKFDNGLAAFTTNPSLHATAASNGAIYYYWSFSTKVGIRSIDYVNGLIDIEGYELDSDYKIYSSYYYEEKNFEFTSVDLNPLNNSNILDSRLVLFIDPDSSEESSSQTLYYLLVDRKNLVIESDWPSFSNTNQLLTNGHELYYLDAPSFVIPAVGYESFVSDYSVEGDGFFLIVSELTVSTPGGVEDIEVTDARVPGGGIVEGDISGAKSENPEVIWYWDIGRWDGQPYPGNASYYVDVPVSVLLGAGGTFTQKKVKDVVKKHTALGVYPVVKAYGIDPYVTDVQPSSSSVYLEWYSYGSDKYYNVYYSKDASGPWTKSNTSLISDDHTGNSHTITGLSSGVVYYIMIIGGEMDGSVFLPQNGQAIGPVEDGTKSLYNSNIAQVKTL